MKIGFIGCGNMAQAVIGGILSKKIFTEDQIFASVKTEASAEKVREKLQIACGTENKKVAEGADVLFLAVKPQFLEEVCEEIRPVLTTEQVIISVAAGKKLEWLEEHLGADKKIIRAMPNTPALAGAGVTGVCKNDQVPEEDLAQAMEILSSFGSAKIETEKMLDLVGAVAGSSPAFVFMFIEALADGAVAEGMPRKKAYEYAASAVYGSAKLMLETGKHPGELKDMVCSPAGTTIEGVSTLEAKGMRSAVMDAVRACIEKTKKL